MGHSEEFHGAIYYCNECIGAICVVCGYMEPEKAKLLEEEVKLLDGLLADLRQENMDLQEGLDALLRARFISRDVPDPVPDDLVSVRDNALTSLEDSGDTEGESPEGSSPVGSGEGTTSEPLYGEGVGDVRPGAIFDAGGDTFRGTGSDEPAGLQFGDSSKRS